MKQAPRRFWWLPLEHLSTYAVHLPDLPGPALPDAITTQWVDPSTGYETAFSDGFPFLLASTESLADLSSRLPEPGVPMNRFRPNIVVSGLSEPWEEDTWAEFLAGEVSFHAPKPCARCKVGSLCRLSACSCFPALCCSLGRVLTPQQ